MRSSDVPASLRCPPAPCLTGEFKDGEMSGSGRRNYCDGGCYEGEWHAGLKHGQGKLFLHQGDSYEGHFYEGKMHGHGVYCLANGDTYSGGMREGLMHGEGEYCFALPHNGRYKGQFVNNVRHGKGTLEFEENGLTYRYAGDFNEDAQTGRAVLHISNGDKYSGEFQDGRFHGHGEYVFNDGSRYDGEFADGVMHGVGSFVAAFDTSEIHGDGERFEGQWRNGVRHGKGVVKLVGVCLSRRAISVFMLGGAIFFLDYGQPFSFCLPVGMATWPVTAARQLSNICPCTSENPAQTHPKRDMGHDRRDGRDRRDPRSVARRRA